MKSVCSWRVAGAVLMSVVMISFSGGCSSARVREADGIEAGPKIKWSFESGTRVRAMNPLAKPIRQKFREAAIVDGELHLWTDWGSDMTIPGGGRHYYKVDLRNGERLVCAYDSGVDPESIAEEHHLPMLKVVRREEPSTATKPEPDKRSWECEIEPGVQLVQTIDRTGETYAAFLEVADANSVVASYPLGVLKDYVVGTPWLGYDVDGDYVIVISNGYVVCVSRADDRKQ